MSDGTEQATAAQDRELRVRAGMRWLAWGSVVALVALVACAVLAAASGSPAGMVAANSGSIALVIASTYGYLALKTRLAQIETTADDMS